MDSSQTKLGTMTYDNSVTNSFKLVNMLKEKIVT